MRWIALAALLGGCSEYEMNSPRPALGADEGASGPAAGGGSGDGGSQDGSTTAGGGFGDDGGDGRIPDEFVDDDCGDGILATWLSGMLVTMANDPGPAIGAIDVPQSGVYDVYDLAIAESGPSQRNESAYLRVPTGSSPDGLPMFANCADEWVVPDSDNAGPVPAGTAQYLGTFWFDAGVNEVQMHHYCPVYLSGDCASFHDDSDAASVCGTSNPNSVHLEGAAICLRPAG